jgi:hypothetical protein
MKDKRFARALRRAADGRHEPIAATSISHLYCRFGEGRVLAMPDPQQPLTYPKSFIVR